MPTFENPYIDPATIGGAHAASHAVGGLDPVSPASIGAAGVAHTHTPASLGAVATNDARLSDARTPTAHKTAHAAGGSDQLTPGDIGAAETSHSHADKADLVDGKVPSAQLPAMAVGSCAWDEITDKPTVFPAVVPSWDEVTDKPTVFPAAAPSWDEVTDKPFATLGSDLYVWVDGSLHTCAEIVNLNSQMEAVASATIANFVYNPPVLTYADGVLSVSLTRLASNTIGFFTTIGPIDFTNYTKLTVDITNLVASGTNNGLLLMALPNKTNVTAYSALWTLADGNTLTTNPTVLDVTSLTGNYYLCFQTNAVGSSIAYDLNRVELGVF